jgi:hypothetical protein
VTSTFTTVVTSFPGHTELYFACHNYVVKKNSDIRVIRKVSFFKKDLPNFSPEFWAEFGFYRVLSEYTAHVQ